MLKTRFGGNPGSGFHVGRGLFVVTILALPLYLAFCMPNGDDEKYLDMPGRKRITLTVINQISPVSLYVMLRRLGHSI